MRAALQFTALCQAESFQQVLLGMGPAPDAEAIARNVRVAVDSFMRIWGEE
jgi:hypothetical protein